MRAAAQTRIDIRVGRRHIVAPFEAGPQSEKYVANSASARKRAHQAETRRQQNAGQRSVVRTVIKKVQSAIGTGDYEAASGAYAAAVPVIDRMADKGILHKNKAARHKSRLNTQVHALKA